MGKGPEQSGSRAQAQIMPGNQSRPPRWLPVARMAKESSRESTEKLVSDS